MARKTKECWACNLRIPIGQIKCHRCEQWQNWRRHLSFINTTVLALVTAMLSILTVLVPLIGEYAESRETKIDLIYAGLTSSSSTTLSLSVSNPLSRSVKVSDRLICKVPNRRLGFDDTTNETYGAVFVLTDFKGIQDAISFPIIFPSERYTASFQFEEWQTISVHRDFITFLNRTYSEDECFLFTEGFGFFYDLPDLQSADWRETADAIQLSEGDLVEIGRSLSSLHPFTPSP